MWRCAGNWPRPCPSSPEGRDEALKAYGEALKLNDDLGLRLRRISLLLEARRWDEAARELKDCPVPEDPRLIQEQARLLVWLGDLPHALARYDLLLQKTPRTARSASRRPRS